MARTLLQTKRAINRMIGQFCFTCAYTQGQCAQRGWANHSSIKTSVVFFIQKKYFWGGCVTNNIYWPDSSDDHLDDPVHSHDGDEAAHSAGPDDKHTNHMEAAILFPAVAARGQHCAGVGDIWAVWVLHISLLVPGNCVVASMQDMLLFCLRLDSGSQCRHTTLLLRLWSTHVHSIHST